MTRLSELIRREPKRGPLVPPWLERISSIGIVTGDKDVARRQRITNIGAFSAAGTALSHLVINALHNAGGLIAIHIFNAVFALLALLTPCLHRYGENAAAVALASLVLLGTLLIVWLLGTASHLQMYFTLIGALLLFIGTQNWKLFSAYFILFTAALLITLKYAPPEGLIMPQDTSLRDILTGDAMINAITINAVIIFYALAALRRAEIELENEYERSEALVAAMIPTSIARRLKSGDTRFSYDVWGDTVNVAARMESHGVPDRIHVSEDFRAVTGESFVFVERGMTDVKSIGLVQTFFLTAART